MYGLHIRLGVITSAWELLEGWNCTLPLHLPPSLDWGLLEDRHLAFFIRPMTPRMGSVLPPLGPGAGSCSQSMCHISSGLTNGLTLSGWEVKVEGGSRERSVPKMFSSAMCYPRSERQE